ncbi:uncharacterized protein At4g02000-like [Tripterygium wilfordii]|uniref:uncharacterized protein At4g02000-like n=1 Tax=Tripterygium wilfordii TaxID=458696 RepID=UPI0018F8555C|nr:uncharacterized protein At4g02000-like [Tripterygium wilfordii]
MDADLEKRWQRLSLMTEESEAVVVARDSGTTKESDTRFSLFGRLLSSRSFNQEAFFVTMKNIWKPIRGMEISTVGENLYLLHFFSKEDYNKVLDGSPWTFDKHPLLLKEYNGNLRPCDVVFEEMPLWVRFCNLPFKMMNEKVGLQLGAAVGRIEKVDLDRNGCGWGKYLRVRIHIDITKPLKRVVMVTGEEGGAAIRVGVQYERLPNFCYMCGKLGHVDHDCEVGETDFPEPKPYGDWLRSSPPRGRRPTPSSDP